MASPNDPLARHGVMERQGGLASARNILAGGRQVQQAIQFAGQHVLGAQQWQQQHEYNTQGPPHQMREEQVRAAHLRVAKEEMDLRVYDEKLQATMKELTLRNAMAEVQVKEHAKNLQILQIQKQMADLKATTERLETTVTLPDEEGRPVQHGYVAGDKGPEFKRLPEGYRTQEYRQQEADIGRTQAETERLNRGLSLRDRNAAYMTGLLKTVMSDELDEETKNLARERLRESLSQPLGQESARGGPQDINDKVTAFTQASPENMALFQDAYEKGGMELGALLKVLKDHLAEARKEDPNVSEQEVLGAALRWIAGGR